MAPSALSLLNEIVGHPANQGSQAKALIRTIYWQCFKRLTNRPWDISYHGKLLLVWMVYRLAMPILIERMSA
jgi:hypothetical protein